MLNPIFNTAKTWEWIDTMLSGAICMVKLYNSDYDLNKKDLLITKNLCLLSAIDAFNCMELSLEGQEMARDIETERNKAYELAIIAASDPTSPFAEWNATRADCHRHNAERLMARLKKGYGYEFIR